MRFQEPCKCHTLTHPPLGDERRCTSRLRVYHIDVGRILTGMLQCHACVCSRERKRERERVSECVCERERERERESTSLDCIYLVAPLAPSCSQSRATFSYTGDEGEDRQNISQHGRNQLSTHECANTVHNSCVAFWHPNWMAFWQNIPRHAFTLPLRTRPFENRRKQQQQQHRVPRGASPCDGAAH